jgi:anti-anti-sigma regulatory factor
MFLATINKVQQLLHVSYIHRVRAEELRSALKDVDALLADLKPGFAALVDLDRLASMDTDCIPELAKLMDACSRKGVGLVVRVIPDPRKDIGLNILSLFHYRKPVKLVTCASLEEAARELKL